MQLLDFFQQLMADDKDLCDLAEEPPEKKLKIDPT